jgi:radical SAM protein with 4Fe4S-binding SPASM domain
MGWDASHVSLEGAAPSGPTHRDSTPATPARRIGQAVMRVKVVCFNPQEALTHIQNTRIVRPSNAMTVGERFRFMGNCLGVPSNFEQDLPAIRDAVRNNRLLTMEIEFSLRCNFSCPYCYVPKADSFQDELTLDEIRDVVVQAQDMGARKIIILGGEPTIYPDLKIIVGFIRDRGLQVELFTNGTGIDDELAAFFFANQVRVVLKMNTFDSELQDRLSGKKGAFAAIHSALEALRKAGYPADGAFLAVSTVICAPNIDELPRLWRWLRDQNIVPYFEMITPQANAVDNQWLFVEPRRVHRLFEELAEIDRNEYNSRWDPQPPLVGNRCLRHMFSCLVTSKGLVMPCVGINVPLGNIREQRLADIVGQSQIIKDLKNHRQTIKGPCRECEKAEQCYGCRGAAFQITGDYLASDPLCWHNCSNSDTNEYGEQK